MKSKNVRARLVHYIHDLERMEQEKKQIADDIKESLATAKTEGFDPETIKAVLKLRKLTPEQRSERKALEAIYMAALGMLDGEALSDAVRRRLDEQPALKETPPETAPDAPQADAPPAEQPPPQPTLPLKDPAEAKAEGEAAARAGKRIYDNPYQAGDPCRAAWDEGWCTSKGSHGMDVPQAYQRRQPDKPPKKDDDAPGGDAEKDAA